jgi:hypothetical protein
MLTPVVVENGLEVLDILFHNSFKNNPLVVLVEVKHNFFLHSLVIFQNKLGCLFHGKIFSV